MRRLFVILMVLLLPLRGWAVEDMTVRMAGLEVMAATASADASAAEAAMPADCPMMAKAGTGEPASHHATSCQACQLCMALAGTVSPAANALPGFGQAPPVLGATPFASADLPRQAEPPIS